MMYLEVDGELKAKKNLGQNFLTNDTIIKYIVSFLDLDKDSLVIEIGPGRGALTKELAKTDANILCIEIDKDLKPILNTLEGDKLHVIYGDILNIDLKEIIKDYNYTKLYVIGNLPYYITSPIMEYIIYSGINPNTMLFMVQNEVADRFSAKEKNSDYGYMTLFIKYYYDCQKVLFVDRSNFNPIPKVDSAVIKLDRCIKNYNVDEEKYFAFLKECFKYKRKTLKNNLKGYDIDVSPNVRAEELTEEEFIELFRKISK